MDTLRIWSPPVLAAPAGGVADSKYTVPSGPTDTLGRPGAKMETPEASVRAMRPLFVETTTRCAVAVHPTIWRGIAATSAGRGATTRPADPGRRADGDDGQTRDEGGDDRNDENDADPGQPPPPAPPARLFEKGFCVGHWRVGGSQRARPQDRHVDPSQAACMALL